MTLNPNSTIGNVLGKLAADYVRISAEVNSSTPDARDAFRLGQLNVLATLLYELTHEGSWAASVGHVNEGVVELLTAQRTGRRAGAAVDEQLNDFEQVDTIYTACDLRGFARSHALRNDWHEPDNSSIDAVVYGARLDNAGFYAGPHVDDAHTELTVYLLHDGKPAACINLATLLALAARSKE